MNRNELVEQIRTKQSYLCVGLDTDITKIPAHIKTEEDTIFAFNKKKEDQIQTSFQT